MSELNNELNNELISEEEKKAIEYWKRDIELYHYNAQLASEHYAQIILNLIEKQQNKIERYETILKRQEQLEQEKENLIKQGWINE